MGKGIEEIGPTVYDIYRNMVNYSALAESLDDEAV